MAKTAINKNFRLYYSSGWKLEIGHGNYFVFYLFIKYFEKKPMRSFQSVPFEEFDLICIDFLTRDTADEFREFLNTKTNKK